MPGQGVVKEQLEQLVDANIDPFIGLKDAANLNLHLVGQSHIWIQVQKGKQAVEWLVQAVQWLVQPVQWALERLVWQCLLLLLFRRYHQLFLTLQLQGLCCLTQRLLAMSGDGSLWVMEEAAVFKAGFLVVSMGRDVRLELDVCVLVNGNLEEQSRRRLLLRLRCQLTT